MRSMLRRIPMVREWFRHDIEPPTWQGDDDGRRVLLEEEDPVLRHAMALALRDAGFRTAECSGPGSHGDGRCPLVEGAGCSAVDEADAVGHQLPVFLLQHRPPNHDNYLIMHR